MPVGFLWAPPRLWIPRFGLSIALKCCDHPHCCPTPVSVCSLFLMFFLLLGQVCWWWFLCTYFALLTVLPSQTSVSSVVFASFLRLHGFLGTSHCLLIFSSILLSLPTLLPFLSRSRTEFLVCLYLFEILSHFLLINIWNLLPYWTYFIIFEFSNWRVLIFWRSQITLLFHISFVSVVWFIYFLVWLLPLVLMGVFLLSIFSPVLDPQHPQQGGNKIMWWQRQAHHQWPEANNAGS